MKIRRLKAPAKEVFSLCSEKYNWQKGMNAALTCHMSCRVGLMHKHPLSSSLQLKVILNEGHYDQGTDLNSSWNFFGRNSANFSFFCQYQFLLISTKREGLILDISFFSKHFG